MSGYGRQTTAEIVTSGIDLSNRTIIVTGSSSGIGEETARVLALRGANVILAVRNVAAGEKSKKRILPFCEGKDDRVTVMELDLSSKSSVEAFSRKFLALDLPLHTLINNAGIMAAPFSLTNDGYESQFATNHLGHFLLTSLLLEKLKSTANEYGTETRIVNLSSSLHRNPYPEGIRFSELNSEKGYTPFGAYGQSKLANILHSNELTRRLRADGVTNVTANSVHPGVILTNLTRHVASPGIRRTVFLGVYNLFLRWHWKTVPQGTATTCYVATHPSLTGVSGKFFVDCNEEEPSKFAQDEAMAKTLWNISDQMVV